MYNSTKMDFSYSPLCTKLSGVKAPERPWDASETKTVSFTLQNTEK